MIVFFKKIVRKLQGLRQRMMGLLKQIIRKVAGVFLRVVSKYPRLAGFAIRILNRFPQLKAFVRRLVFAPRVKFSLADTPSTVLAQQFEHDLHGAIARKQGR